MIYSIKLSYILGACIEILIKIFKNRHAGIMLDALLAYYAQNYASIIGVSLFGPDWFRVKYLSKTLHVMRTAILMSTSKAVSDHALIIVQLEYSIQWMIGSL